MPVTPAQLKKMRRALDGATTSSEAEEAPVPVWVVRLLCELYELLAGYEAAAKSRRRPAARSTRKKPARKRR